MANYPKSEDLLKAALEAAEREMYEAIDRYYQMKASLVAFGVKRNIAAVEIADDEDGAVIIAIRAAINEIKDFPKGERDFTVTNVTVKAKLYLVDPQIRENLTAAYVGKLCRRMGYTVRRRTRGENRGRYEVVI